MTKEKFNSLYLGKAIHCTTEELANEFLELAKSFGYDWRVSTSSNYWGTYKEKTCYDVGKTCDNIGKRIMGYGCLETFERYEYTIIEYKSLKDELKMSEFTKLIFGALYKANDNINKYLPNYNSYMNEQKYGLWVPVRVKTKEIDKLYMIDTYRNRPMYGASFDKILEKLKEFGKEQDNSWYANSPYGDDYSARVELNENTIKAFDLYVNLEEYRVLESSEEDDFLDSDKINSIKLYSEHKYPNGLTLVRKDAKINYDYKVNSLFNEIIYTDLRTFSCYSYNIVKINELKDKVADTRKIDIVNKLYEKYEGMSKEYRELYNKLINGIKEEKE